jgi:Leucine-rich repeat (LRR) protein
MLNVKELDLSGSRLTELPTQGLKKLERLRLVKVPSLKKLPSVLAFNNLHTAEFTYPYHCCFFKVINIFMIIKTIFSMQRVNTNVEETGNFILITKKFNNESVIEKQLQLVKSFLNVADGIGEHPNSKWIMEKTRALILSDGLRR